MQAYLTDESGASAAEYALLLGVIGAAVAVAIFMLADSIGSRFGAAAGVLDSTNGQVASAAGGPGSGAGGGGGGGGGGGTGSGPGGGGGNQGWHGAGHGGGRGQGAGGGRGNNP